MSEKIYVLIDHTQGEVPLACWETLALAQKIGKETGAELQGLVMGSREAAEKASSKNLGGIIHVADERLAEYDPDLSTAALKQVLESDLPRLLIMAHSYRNIDLAPKLAAALRKGLVTDCIGFRQEGDELVFVRQMFRNKLNADIRVESGHPWLVSVQAGACPMDELEAGECPITERSVDLDGVEVRRRTLETIAGSKGKVDLTKADIIIGVGRGIKKKENLALIEELAEALGAEIGASRPVVDNDWMERERQIGSSGQTVTPKLYVGCGISGAIQHVVGMKSANCIVAINTDPNAPIFNIATYGIVGDLFEVVPALTRRLTGD